MRQDILESGHAAREEAGTLPSNGTSTPRGAATLTEIFPLELLEKLKAISRSEKVSLSITLLGAYHSLLYRYGGEEDSSVSPTANLSGTEALSSILGGGLSGNPTFRQLLQRGHSALPGQSDQNAPFQNLGAIPPEGNLNGTPLFQIRLALGTAPRPQLNLPAVDPRAFAVHGGESQPDFGLSLIETPDGLSCTVQYATDLFEANAIRRFLGHFRTLLQAIAADPDLPVATLPILTPEEKQTLLVDFNRTGVNFVLGKCIHQLVEAQAARTPENIALVFENQRLTYRELNARANQLAHFLRKQGVGPETLVGMCMDRSLEMVVGIVGILKAGGAYLPLDITYPPDRLAFMIGDAKPPIVLTQQRLVDQLPEHAARIVCLDRDWETIAQESAQNPESGSRPENLAYVIYTSGSTGKPKGVQVTHYNVVRLFQATWDWYKFDQRDVWTMFHSYAFDFSVWEIWGALFYGGRVVVVPYMVSRSPEDFYKLLHAEGVTVLNQTPSAFRQLILAEESVGMRRLALRLVIFGGEALEMQSLKPWFDRHGDQTPKLVNMYGITETTVHVTYRPLSSNDTKGGSVIGCPIPDLQLYLLDQHRQPVPIGIAAEMYVGGAGVARGYLNRPELTAERFIPDPFSNHPKARLYKTGDLARFLPNGDIEYLGRIDHQVKIRGFRVELGEIEKTLESCPGICQSVVVALDDPSGGKRLVGYVAAQPKSEDSAKPEVEELVSAERVSQWAMTFDETYGRAGKPGDASFNIAGWNSSYTGQPIPSEEMQVWVETTVDRILALRPKRVWEIGCGTGLLLFRVAPGCERYHGTDISQTAVELLQQQLSRSQPNLPQVTLARRAAHEVDGIGSDFDTVILNSVMQYFPDLQYFTTVIEGAVRAVRPGGTMFIGDVRNFALLEMFHTSVQLHQAPDSLSTAELRRRIQTRISEEPELLIDPDFFLALQQRIPQISEVRIQLKRGRAHNELTRFRYDVFLKIGQPDVETADCTWLDWDKDKLSLTELRQMLVQQQPEILGLTGVPDARLGDEVAAVNMLASDNRPPTTGQLRQKLKQVTAASVEPEDLWDLERNLPYQLEIRAASDGSCNVLFRRKTADGDVDGAGTVRFPSESNGNRPLRTYANNPLQKTISQEMASQLRRLLRAKLPEYMVPSAFVLLDSIPLTGNGKVDRRALPPPDWSRPEARSDYVAPQTPVEETIAAIFADVMKLEQVGRNDHFFEIGGHSLSAAQVVSRLGHALQVEVPLRCLFESPSVAALAQAVEGMQRKEHRAEMPAIVSGQKRLGLPLSIAQEALWYQQQVTPDSPAYNVPMLARLQGDLDVAALEKAVAALVERHELLRSVFLTTGGTPLLFPVKKWRGTLQPVDLRHLSESDREAEAQRLIQHEASRPFDLARDSMFRCLLLRVQDKEWLFLHNSPHIVFDGASFPVLYRELASFYNAFVSGKSPELPALPFQFADFAAWQRRCLQGEYLNSLTEYWKRQLTGAPRVDMPSDFPRPPVFPLRGARRFFAMAPDLVSATNTFARKEGTTPFRCFYAAFNLFLHCYTGLKDICVGSPVGPLNPACRGVENLIGYFVNTLVLRTNLSGDPTFREVVRRAEGVVDGAMAHSDLPFIKVVEALQLPRDPSRPVLFQVNFRAVNQIFPSWQLEGVAAEPSAYVDNGTSKFDLALEIESSTGRTCYFEYRTDLFREETIMQMEQDYQALLRGLIAQPEVPISKLAAVMEVSRRIRSRTAAGKSL